MDILVVGATGVLGSEISRKLVSAGHNTSGVARGLKQENMLRGMGVVPTRADLTQYESLERACTGKGAVVASATAIMSQRPEDNLASVDHDGMIALIDAAKKARVAQFIFTSFHPMSDRFPLQDAKRAVEKHLQNSGLPYTILQPSFFVESWLTGPLAYDPSAKTFNVYGTGDQKVSWVALADVARVTAGCLENPKALNRTIEFGGRESLSGNEVAEILKRSGIVDLKTIGKTVDELRAAHAAAVQQNDPVWQSVAGLMLQAAQGRVTPWENAASIVDGKFLETRTLLASFAKDGP